MFIWPQTTYKLVICFVALTDALFIQILPSINTYIVSRLLNNSNTKMHRCGRGRRYLFLNECGNVIWDL